MDIETWTQPAADNPFEAAVLDRLDKLIDLLTPNTVSGPEIHYHFAPDTETTTAGGFAQSHPVNLKGIA